MKKVRIGSGAGYAGDRIEPAIDLMKQGNLDYIIFECLAERTISIAQKRKQGNPNLGYNDLLEYRFDRILDAWQEKPVRVITNMGAANPKAAAEKCREMAEEKKIIGLKIAYVTGDDVTGRLGEYQNYVAIETGKPLSDIHGEILSANGYIGVAGIVKALEMGADIVITGRVADPSLTLGPLVHEFGWSMDDYTRLSRGTLAGHLLECAGQVTGGYYADPGYKDVPRLWDLGFPIAEVDEDGICVISKLESAGGMVTEDTVKEQIIYEIQDPENYYTPDVIADFSKVRVEQIGMDRVRITGIDGKAPNGYYKTSVGYHDCYIGEGQISYGGSNALKRAQLAREILEHRFEMKSLDLEEVRFDYIGVNSLYRDKISGEIANSGYADRKAIVTGTCCDDTGVETESAWGNPVEVRLRAAARTQDRETAELIGNEVEALYTNGPCGGGGAEKCIRDIVSIASILIPVDHFEIHVALV
ncbi:MAG: DUF1446 domain-containing protein [Clostridiales bacterium]|nr:DUF1446 domain-containing protein [Clostridiales bacterium]